jgi:hypothetical protein
MNGKSINGSTCQPWPSGLDYRKTRLEAGLPAGSLWKAFIGAGNDQGSVHGKSLMSRLFKHV